MATSAYCSSRRKRALDLVLATAALVPAAVVLPLCWVAARLSIGRGVIFGHQRAGLNGTTITVWKLRTMTDERDANGGLLPDVEQLTRVGRVLRATSLDELPQLWNVLRGEMSIVGPRPLLPSYVERYTPTQRRRLDAKPGITGWAQVRGRNTLSWPERLSLDAWYVEHASLRLDLRILWLTVKAVVSGKGVSAEGHATMPEFSGGE